MINRKSRSDQPLTNERLRQIENMASVMQPGNHHILHSLIEEVRRLREALSVAGLAVARGLTVGPLSERDTQERDALICAEYAPATGGTVRWLAQRYNLTPERIKQILRAGGVYEPKQRS